MKTIAVLVVLMFVSGAHAQDWRDTLELARTAYTSKDYDKALEYYQDAQSGAPDGVDLSDEMGQSAYKAKKYDVAEKIYQQNQANKTSPKSQADNYHNLGNSRMRSKDYKGAAEAYKDALRRNPNDKKTRYNLSEAMRQIKKEERKKEKQQQQQQKQQQNQNQSQGNNQQQNQNGQKQQQSKNGQSQQSKNGQKQQSGGQKGQQNSQQRKGNGSPKNANGKKGESQLSNKTADRMLDDLMKREAATQRRMSGGGSGGGRSKSGKDW